MIELAFVEPEWRVTLRETRTRPAAKVNLATARKVVCVGRGLAKAEDLALVEELARLLGAEVACTRPLAEGLDWLPRERYIGISGATVRPDLYLGIGVSGQAQHTIGMSEARVVAAINKDEGAPIFEQADYRIVDDLYTVVPALIACLKARR
jgi:electron transfer flavoprotein alpha subunit